MRKYTFLLLLFVSISVFAQRSRRLPLRIGASLEPKYTFFSPSSIFIEPNNNNVGASLSLIGEKFFSRNFALKAAIAYRSVNSGIAIHDSLHRDIATSDYKLKYLGLQLGGRFVSTSLSFAEKFRISAGAYIIPMMNFNSRTSFSSDKLPGIDEISKFDISFKISFGTEYEIDRVTFLFAEINYDNGIFDVINTESITPYTNTNNGGVVKSGSIGLEVGFLYTINR